MAQALNIDTERPLDRSGHPGIPPVVADLWRTSRYAGTTDPGDLARAIEAVDAQLNALTQGGGRYMVTLSGGISTAATDLEAQSGLITTAALFDQRLSVIERLGITSAMAFHEAGHGRLTKPIGRAVRRAFGVHRYAARLSNIGEDARLEADTVSKWPMFGPLFDLALWWVANRYPTGAIRRLPRTRDEAVNFAVAAVRYAAHTVWPNDPDVLAERAWWTDWGLRMAVISTPAQHVAVLREAVERIDTLPELAAPEPPMPAPGQSSANEDAESGDEDGEGASGSAQPTEDEDDPAEAGDEDAAEAGDEAGDEDADGSGTGAEADEADEADGDATQAAEPDATGLGGSEDTEDPEDTEDTEDDGSEADVDEDEDGGEVEDGYAHRDHMADTGSDAEGEATRSGPTVYGRNDVTEAAAESDTMPGAEPKRDALDAALPLHARDSLTWDDRNRDVQVGQAVGAARISRMNAESIVTVTHKDGQNVAVRINKASGTGPTRASTDAQGALRAAFSQRRTSHDARNVARSGRLSGSRAYRVRAGFDNVFMRRDALSPDRLDVHVLVDASGSMAGPEDSGPGQPAKSTRSRVEAAIQVTATLVGALDALPFVRTHVWAHNTHRGTAVWDVYDSSKGDPIDRIGTIRPAGSNNDASAIMAVLSRIIDDRKPRERSILLVVSDGAPCEDEAWVADAAEAARRADVQVVSVAIAGGLTTTQEACYGARNVIPWGNDWDRLGQDMAQALAQRA